MEHIEVETLFSYAMKGQWREVLGAYDNNLGALEAKITRGEDSVLHIAVYVGQTSFVASLLDNITGEVCLAAEVGNVDICNNIARRDPSLICWCNFEGETPLFLAAIHGKTDAFFCLHGHLQSQDDYSLCINNKRDTVLHSTISSEYFGLALKLIGLYPTLADSVNQEGLSPLHILAMKPNCFKSSTRMGLLDRFTYKCLIIDELKEDTDWRDIQIAHHDNPKNYGTCMSFIYLLKSAVKVTTLGKDCKAATDDEENVSRKSCLRYGSSWIEKIERKEDKHLRAKQVMNELIQRALLCEHDYTGRNPRHTIQHENNSKGNTDRCSNTKKKGTLVERRIESPILIAAKMGITEMVAKILEAFPVAIQDVDSENKNVVLLAIENRQPHVRSLLSKMDIIFKETAFRQVDSQGNSALHLAATCRNHKPWRVPGAAMQMQWEVKWYKLVKSAMPPNSYELYNKERQTAKQVFVRQHTRTARERGEQANGSPKPQNHTQWLQHYIVATVAFTTNLNSYTRWSQSQATGMHASTLERKTCFQALRGGIT